VHRFLLPDGPGASHHRRKLVGQPEQVRVVEALDVRVHLGPLHPDGGAASPDGQHHLQLIGGSRLRWSRLLPAVIGIIGNIGFVGIRLGVQSLSGFQVARAVRCVSGGKLIGNFGRGVVRRFLSHAAEEELFDVHHVLGLVFRSGFVGHGISLSDSRLVRRVPVRAVLDFAQGLRLPVQVALHSGNAAEHGGLGQLGEVEVTQLPLEPLHQPEALAGPGVHLGDKPRPLAVRTEQLGVGKDGIVVSNVFVGVYGGDGVGQLLGHQLVSALSSVLVLPHGSRGCFTFVRHGFNLLIGFVHGSVGAVHPASLRPTSRATVSGVT